MTNAAMARALGVDTTRIYMLTFGLGSFLAGIAGALFSLAAPIQPTFGAAYTPIAFIVVVVAGSRNIIIGLTLSVLALALMKTLFTLNFNILTGYVAMLLAALLVIRASPDGIGELLVKVRRLAAPRFGRS
jgi:branched-chain amino acid transport system permease protein